METKTQFTVFLVSRPGVLSQICRALAAEKVNIVALTMMDGQEHGVLRLVAANMTKARAALKKMNAAFTETEVLAVDMPNKPGAAADVCEKLARARRTLERSSRTLTSDDVDQILNEFATLLTDGVNGKLGEDAVYRAFAVFRGLTGGCIMVHVEPRPARKQTNVRGLFQPRLLVVVRDKTDLPPESDDPVPGEVEVWLRKPPRLDRLAPRVHQLIDVEGMSFRAAARQLQREGHRVNLVVVWQIYDRYYEMIGQPKPKKPYNNGNSREST